MKFILTRASGWDDYENPEVVEVRDLEGLLALAEREGCKLIIQTKEQSLNSQDLPAIEIYDCYRE